MEELKKEISLTILSVVKKEEILETSALKKDNQCQNNTTAIPHIKQEQNITYENESVEVLETCALKKDDQCSNNTTADPHIKQEKNLTYENESVVRSEENIDTIKVDIYSEDYNIKLETEIIIDENIEKCETELKYDIEDKFIKSENECKEAHDSLEKKCLLIAECGKPAYNDYLSWYNEDTKSIIKENSFEDSLCLNVKKGDSEAFLRQSEMDISTSTTQRQETKTRKGLKRLLHHVRNDNDIKSIHTKKVEDTKSISKKTNFNNKKLERIYPKKCNYCKECLMSERSLATHLQKHKTTCGICFRSFANKYSLKAHIRRHATKTYICETCDKCFAIKGHIKKHIEIAHLTTKGIIRKHIKIEHLLKHKTTCEICSKSFASKYYLKAHRKKHNVTNTYTCESCNKCFTTKGNIRKHIKIAHSLKHRMTCDICSRSFTDKSKLLAHVQIHNTTKDYACESCEKYFTTKDYIIKHIKQVHCNTQYTCNVCSETFNNPSSYRFHLSLHRGDTYTCDICNRIFTNRHCLYQHMLIHLGMKKKKHRTKIVYCSVCSKSFRRTDSLKVHIMSIHNHVKFTCDICLKSYRRKYILVKHIKKHLLGFPM